MSLDQCKTTCCRKQKSVLSIEITACGAITVIILPCKEYSFQWLIVSSSELVRSQQEQAQHDSCCIGRCYRSAQSTFQQTWKHLITWVSTFCTLAASREPMPWCSQCHSRNDHLLTPLPGRAEGKCVMRSRVSRARVQAPVPLCSLRTW